MRYTESDQAIVTFGVVLIFMLAILPFVPPHYQAWYTVGLVVFVVVSMVVLAWITD